MIGAIIMVHGDNNGLVLPPRIAPTQVVIVPIQQQKEGVLDKAFELRDVLSNFRVKVDDSDKSPGWKFSESEMRGIPVRVEIGPRDIENNEAVLVRRDTHEKITVSLDEIEAKVSELLDTIQNDMLERARAHRDSHTYVATAYDVCENHQRETGLCKSYVVRRSGLRGQDQRRHCSNLPLHAVRAGEPLRQVRMLWKTGQEDGLLGQSILKFYIPIFQRDPGKSHIWQPFQGPFLYDGKFMSRNSGPVQ